MSEWCYVEIVEELPDGGEKVCTRMGPFPRGRALKVSDGADINLNHERFFTRLVSSPEPEIKS